MALPAPAYQDAYSKSYQAQFLGLDHRIGARDGSLWDMENLTGEYYPVMKPRKPRYLVSTLSDPRGLLASDELCWVDGTSFYYGGEEKITGLSDSQKTLVAMGVLILIFPDNRYYNIQTGESGSMEYEYTAAAGTATFMDGTYAEEPAERNTLRLPGTTVAQGLREYDAVTISGATLEKNNQTVILREIATDSQYTYLRFYAETFDVSGGSSYTDAAAITISRKMPDLKFPFVHDNRLWGCTKDPESGTDQIVASALGDPFNFYAYDSASEMGSYFSDVLTPGDWTGACSFAGYPCFFKQDYIYKVYGTLPSDFSIMSAARMGVDEGSGKSLAIAGEKLYYLSLAGVVQYAGSFPYPVGQAFGDLRFRNAVAGSDGLQYYVSMQLEDGSWKLYIYDTQTGLWHIHDGLHVLDFAWMNGGLYALCDDGKLWFIGDSVFAPQGSTKEEAFDWFAETAKYRVSSPNRKRIQRAEMTAQLSEGASLSLYFSADDEPFRLVRTIDRPGDYSVPCPIIPRRCDHFKLRIVGKGDAALFSLTTVTEPGSEIH